MMVVEVSEKKKRKETNKKKRDYKYAIYVWRYVAYNRLWNLRVRVSMSMMSMRRRTYRFGLSVYSTHWISNVEMESEYFILFISCVGSCHNYPFNCLFGLPLWSHWLIAIAAWPKPEYNECGPYKKRETYIFRRKTTNKFNCLGFGRKN